MKTHVIQIDQVESMDWIQIEAGIIGNYIFGIREEDLSPFRRYEKVDIEDGKTKTKCFWSYKGYLPNNDIIIIESNEEVSID